MQVVQCSWVCYAQVGIRGFVSFMSAELFFLNIWDDEDTEISDSLSKFPEFPMQQQKMQQFHFKLRV